MPIAPNSHNDLVPNLQPRFKQLLKTGQLEQTLFAELTSALFNHNDVTKSALQLNLAAEKHLQNYLDSFESAIYENELSAYRHYTHILVQGLIYTEHQIMDHLFEQCQISYQPIANFIDNEIAIIDDYLQFNFSTRQLEDNRLEPYHKCIQTWQQHVLYLLSQPTIYQAGTKKV